MFQINSPYIPPSLHLFIQAKGFNILGNLDLLKIKSNSEKSDREQEKNTQTHSWANTLTVTGEWHWHHQPKWKGIAHFSHPALTASKTLEEKFYFSRKSVPKQNAEMFVFLFTILIILEEHLLPYK